MCVLLGRGVGGGVVQKKVICDKIFRGSVTAAFISTTNSVDLYAIQCGSLHQIYDSFYVPSRHNQKQRLAS